MTFHVKRSSSLGQLNGFIGTFTPLQQAVDNVLTAQQVWLIAITAVLAFSRATPAGEASRERAAPHAAVRASE